MRALIAMVLLLTSFAGQGASPSRQAYERARKHYFALKASEEREKFRHNWLKVIAAFTRVADEHPETAEAASAIYTAAELWSDLYRISRRGSDLDQALATYERVVHAHPRSSLADDALWQRSQLFLRHGNRRAPAARAVREILATYPKGDMAARARKLAAELADVPEMPRDAEADATAKGKLVGRRAEGGGTPEVTAIKHWSNPDYTRVAIYLTGPASARAGDVAASASKPARVYVDIRKARLSQKVGTATPVDDNLLQGVRAGQFRAGTVRVVLDLQATVRHRVMVMENPYRVVIDAFSTVAPPKTREPVADAELRGRRVVIDPGHGGKDGGARGPGKVVEKHVTLAISKEVARLLEAEGVEVAMTRATDKHLPLEERTAIANRLDADLFVSIHANAHRNKKVRGIETYFLDVTDDAYALRLAAIENQTSEEQVSDLQLILADLATKVNTEESAALARRVQTRLVRAAKPENPTTRDLGVKSSLFYVLLGARMPSILVETGFLSHTGEGKLLARANYQKSTARAIAEGLLDHLRAPRPAGS